MLQEEHDITIVCRSVTWQQTASIFFYTLQAIMKKKNRWQREVSNLWKYLPGLLMYTCYDVFCITVIALFVVLTFHVIFLGLASWRMSVTIVTLGYNESDRSCFLTLLLVKLDLFTHNSFEWRMVMTLNTHCGNYAVLNSFKALWGNVLLLTYSTHLRSDHRVLIGLFWVHYAVLQWHYLSEALTSLLTLVQRLQVSNHYSWDINKYQQICFCHNLQRRENGETSQRSINPTPKSEHSGDLLLFMWLGNRANRWSG